MKIRALTLNMNSGHGAGGHFRDRIGPQALMENLQAIAEVARKADLVFLQEADLKWAGTNNVNQAHEIARMAGFTHHFCHAHLRSPMPRLFNAIQSGNVIMNRELGTAILSRYPIVERRAHDFGQSIPNAFLRYCARVVNEFKGYVYAAIETPAGRMGAISTHLVNDVLFTITDFLGRGIHGQSLQRMLQVRSLVELIAGSKIPVVLGADLNMVPRESKLHFLDSRKGDRDDYRIALGMYLLREAGNIATIPELFGNGTPEMISRYHTYPSVDPDRTLDYIYATKEFRFLEYQVLPDLVSDHRPVLATLEISG